ncbi:alpha-D-ribose 1-methylphosphonate 5-triphosphate diphosphatase [Streptomyces sp. 110]|uniref:Alpha-D-ribose 1-methylphosphonate 5-triphosphate diphosphatase n=1 Tax=Streptomyces endocoffeicus TaxID=2898945 RepID=A0ABS1Q0E2_9ACTN|nr:alpha-D-ribose 1-methylphosphonate 5-triphosphate diphosphatase [Streptomyces endocoffeicus]MBL1118133.1 alpha-D-ribose 1-methylphosphonate 5-triphosphate diphosphatase [Streptomyces endocoffeicus]
MSRCVFAHARAVLPDRTVDDALLVVEDGRITDVAPVIPGAVPAGAIDLGGSLLLPGLIDTHSDALEKEQRPRPTVEFEPGFAVLSFEGRVRAAGVTTMHHAVSYQTNADKDRTIERSLTLAAAVRERAASGVGLVDHRLLHRLDARDADALDALKDALAGQPYTAGVPPLVSYEDHTPGQGQYRNLEAYRAIVQRQEHLSAEDADRFIRHRIDERADSLPQRTRTLAHLGQEARSGRIRLLAHDVESAEELAGVRAAGAAVAEFPTTREAARAAQDAGMPVVAGAPNVLRGGSHSGNVGAEDLIGEGLVDNLSSDYMPSALLAAALHLAERGVVPLHTAVALITSGAARTAGLADRGALVPGLRADLVVVSTEGGRPTVRMSLLAEESRDTDGAPVSVARLLTPAGR